MRNRHRQLAIRRRFREHITRRGETLWAAEVMRQVDLLRKMLSAVGQIEGTELLQRIGKTNDPFLASTAKTMEAEKS